LSKIYVDEIQPKTTGGVINAKGMVIQVVNHQDSQQALGTAIIPNDDSIPQKTEGTEFMTLSITPKSASSKLLIQVVVSSTASSANALNISALFKNDETNALATTGQYQSVGTGIMTTTYSHYITAGTTSSITFKVRGGASTGNYTFNGYHHSGNLYRNFGGSSASSMTIMEIGG
tara:strand:- start:1458 stop:1982 length:525 start_codon:yes stop_codon:yes gene_type:complete